MKANKELGLGWYEFLRYFPFGLSRIISFLNVFFSLLVLANEMNALALLSVILAFGDLLFRVIVHAHLENYSTKITKAMFWFYLNNVVTGMLSFWADYGIAISVLTPSIFYGSLYLINCNYFEKRSHIFVNECNFWGENISKNNTNNSSNLNSKKSTKFTDDMIALKNAQKIKSGEIADLSVSQIVTLIINLADAKNNLVKEEFEEVNVLFKQLRNNTTKVPMGQAEYLETCFSIIRSFDEIAPYEKYCGGDTSEFAFLMSEIRNKNIDEIRKTKSQIKKIEYFLTNTKPYFDSIKSGKEKLLSDKELDVLVSSKRMTQKEAEDYRISRESVESYFLSENILGENFQEKALKDLKIQLENLRKDGYQQPSLNGLTTSVTITAQVCRNNYCRKCGEKLAEGSKFCHKCGTKISE